MKNKLISLLSILALLTILIGCESDNAIPVSAEYQLEKEGLSQSVENSSSNSVLNKELALARASTAKYHNIQKALADGYVDIDLYIPQMGWHFLNPGYLDENFEIDKPELLVYADKPGGGYRLVAVEYAVPLALSTTAPEGFTGDEDVWHENTGAGLWTLHAWVWLHNPNGIFADFNPQVP
jgi:hypothetical protein